MTDASSLPPSGSLLPGATMRLRDVAALQLRLPTFWRNNPQLWFAQVEATFDLHHIPSEISVSSLTLQPFTRGGSRAAQQHATACERELFLQCLPQSTRLVLAAAGELTLDRLAQLADRVHDASSATVTTLSSTPESSVVSRLESRIDQLAASIEALRTSPHEQRGVSTRQGHRASSPSGPRSSSPRGRQAALLNTTGAAVLSAACGERRGTGKVGDVGEIAKLQNYARNLIRKPVIRCFCLRDEKLYAASHVLDAKEVDGLDVHAKCRSQQGRRVYEVILHTAASFKEDVAIADMELQALANTALLWHYILQENEHPYVGGRKPAALEPHYVLHYFPDINCPILWLLRESSETTESVCKAALEDIVNEVVTAEDSATFEKLLQSPKEVFHALEVEGSYPKMTIRKKKLEEHLSKDCADFYAKNVKLDLWFTHYSLGFAEPLMVFSTEAMKFAFLKSSAHFQEEGTF
ncbi:hypothetical protein HPB50_017386 [Hyalomma asiaticum]|uniref:Uncharacterized protein n=1 Tax=Hyalomma asiaticum TaxID=266040 RepID=A0ACB7RUN8_HYAAI|nr:hypothetical protein HPB50_017386 [Hyalomma asiaticum]